MSIACIDTDQSETEIVRFHAQSVHRKPILCLIQYIVQGTEGLGTQIPQAHCVRADTKCPKATVF